MTSPIASTPPPFGRASEIRSVESLMHGARERGGALVVRGGPAIGKSALLEWACSQAEDRGLRILKTVGVEWESHLISSAELRDVLEYGIADRQSG